MCGRFSLHSPAEILATLFELDWQSLDLEPRYNIAPCQDVLAIRDEDAGRAWCRLKWGLIPAWAKDDKGAARLINARSETAPEKPSFRKAIKSRRCLVPANGFYEWKSQGKAKQPFFIHPDKGLWAFAGIWEQWCGPEGSRVESCSILTTASGPKMSPLHDRMPVVIAPYHFDLWLAREPLDEPVYQGLCRPMPDAAFNFFPVSSQVNSVRNEGPHLIEPWSEQQGLLFDC